jgi:hypothetical protein
MKFQSNIFIQSWEKSGKLEMELQIDGQTEGQAKDKLTVPFGKGGKGLNKQPKMYK